jgi:DNA topoisomerase I
MCRAPRIYVSKAKNAQEAHEAIRPTELRPHPEEVSRYLEAMPPSSTS